MKKNFKKVNAGIIVIGNEILSGRTQDLNVSFIAKWLNEKNGITVHEVRVIPDVEKIIVKTTNELRKKYDYIFVFVRFIFCFRTFYILFPDAIAKGFFLPILPPK